MIVSFVSAKNNASMVKECMSTGQGNRRIRAWELCVAVNSIRQPHCSQPCGRSPCVLEACHKGEGETR